MRIKCTLGTIQKALDELDIYKMWLRERNKLFLERLAQIGIENASTSFANAIYDGFNDVSVDGLPTWIDSNRLAISAHGHSITFIEFGAGVHYSALAHPLSDKFGYTRGSYGHHLGKFDSWRYKGEAGTNGKVITTGKHKGEILTHGNPANLCMYNASKEIRNRILQVAKEIFRHD